MFDLSVFEWILVAVAAWIVLAGLGGFAWSFVVTRLKRLEPPKVSPLPDDTVWLPVLPPVPPVRQRRRTEDLYGFELDAQFYGVIAPSFPEYH